MESYERTNSIRPAGVLATACRQRGATCTCVGSCWWKKLGHEKRLAAYIVNYADDLVICCRGRAEEALARMRDIMTKLKLTVNETKMRVCKLPEEKFDFLGYTFVGAIRRKQGARTWVRCPRRSG
jgi:hypothetical protein